MHRIEGSTEDVPLAAAQAPAMGARVWVLPSLWRAYRPLGKPLLFGAIETSAKLSHSKCLQGGALVGLWGACAGTAAALRRGTLRGDPGPPFKSNFMQTAAHATSIFFWTMASKAELAVESAGVLDE